ncbi:hypothetical protein FM076_29330 [Streptomyces albus subsp. chlorinus]|uniref:hypothetical protein n=1 Tax=Streptomyces albus TaxID=1888 RepID=UPI00156FAD7A|nr:hypothetical protein [Streptomyces albus]NSC25039.1 hypothetical protein [Streptomyces albus subsp. chlorinus]
MTPPPPETARTPRAARRAAALAATALLLSVPALATATTASAAATPPGFSCHTGKHANDSRTGYARCRNNSRTTQTFWVHLVCGLSRDVDGERVTLRPGRSGKSTAHCAALGTGIGRIEVRP